MFYPDKKFIASLSEGEKFIFLKIICGVVAVDRKVSREELVYLRELALKYEVSGDKLSAMIKSSDNAILLKQARMIVDRVKALALIKDMCMVANLDTDLADAEIDYILDVAEAMGIEPRRVQDINAVVNEYLAVSQKAAMLLEQEHWS
ncbi:MAG: TerB family tellurite resistance protein [Acetobacter sp.]|nr:TerB family tellurite resistance protein [Acetobacter sp.]